MNKHISPQCHSFKEHSEELRLTFLYKKNFSIIFLMLIFSLCHCLSATNINGAILKAVRMLEKDRDDKKLPERSVDMIILLTDGMPNKGEPF